MKSCLRLARSQTLRRSSHRRTVAGMLVWQDMPSLTLTLTPILTRYASVAGHALPSRPHVPLARGRRPSLGKGQAAREGEGGEPHTPRRGQSEARPRPSALEHTQRQVGCPALSCTHMLVTGITQAATRCAAPVTLALSLTQSPTLTLTQEATRGAAPAMRAQPVHIRKRARRDGEEASTKIPSALDQPAMSLPPLL